MKALPALQTKFGSFPAVLAALVLAACSADRSENENYATASYSYGILAEKSLDLLASLDLDTWGSMLSDNVVYYFPNGDIRNGKKVAGKKAVLAWWKNYILDSGIRSMSIENASYVPIRIERVTRAGDILGTQVIAYFSNKLVYEKGEVLVKMNFVIHFDENKMIDGYYTYYDRTPIVELLREKSISGEFAISDHARYGEVFKEITGREYSARPTTIRFVNSEFRAGFQPGYFWVSPIL